MYMNDHSTRDTVLTTLRDKTADLRRQHIMEAAIGIFADRGFERATIKDIARAAGVSDGAIYNVFESKTALLEGMLAPLANDFANNETLPASLAPLLRDRWAAFSPQTLLMMQALLSEALINESMRTLFFQRILRPVLEPLGPSEGELMIASDRLRHRALVGALIGLIVLRLLGDEFTQDSWSEFPDLLAGLFEPEPQL
jgi:AcrR family transcriptional regulator